MIPSKSGSARGAKPEERDRRLSIFLWALLLSLICGAIEFGDPDGFAALDPHFFLEERFAEPAIALELDMADLAGQHGDPERAFGNILRWNDRRGDGKSALPHEILNDLGDRGEQTILDGATFSRLQSPQKYGPVDGPQRR